MRLYVVYVPQINSYGDLGEQDMPVSWHLLKESAEHRLGIELEQLLDLHKGIEINEREEEEVGEIISEHCYIQEQELID